MSNIWKWIYGNIGTEQYTCKKIYITYEITAQGRIVCEHKENS